MSTERDDLIQSLARHRDFLVQTADGLTDDDARRVSTVSELTIASLLKHVADTEEQWIAFAVGGTEAFGDSSASAESGRPEPEEWVDDRFVLSDAETLDVLRARVAEVAQQTEQVLRTADLDQAHALPEAPWFEPGVSWSVRRVALHLLAEISQHAGHADIIREAIDGRKSMG